MKAIYFLLGVLLCVVAFLTLFERQDYVCYTFRMDFDDILGTGCRRVYAQEWTLGNVAFNTAYAVHEGTNDSFEWMTFSPQNNLKEISVWVLRNRMQSSNH